MTVSLPSRQRAGYCDIPSPFALNDEAFRALRHPLVDTLGAYLEALPETGSDASRHCLERAAFLAGTDIRGHFALRSCASHYALNEDHVECIVGAVRDAGSRRVSAGLPVPEPISLRGAERPAQDRRAEELECAI